MPIIDDSIDEYFGNPEVENLEISDDEIPYLFEGYEKNNQEKDDSEILLSDIWVI